MNAVLTLLLLSLVQPLAVAAQEIGTLTLVEGPLHVIRGTTVLQGAEGVKLHQGDIIESSNPGFAQLELRGGVVVALGPSTRVFFVSHAAKNPEMFVLDGWLKARGRMPARTAAPARFSRLRPLMAPSFCMFSAKELISSSNPGQPASAR